MKQLSTEHKVVLCIYAFFPWLAIAVCCLFELAWLPIMGLFLVFISPFMTIATVSAFLPKHEHETWQERKARLDAVDDGQGPYMMWAFDSEQRKFRKQAAWQDFLEWANDHLGQAYSLACCDGALIDEVTHYAFKGYLIGRGFSPKSK